MEPKIKVDLAFTERECRRCHKNGDSAQFCRTSSPFFSLGYSDICADCFDDYFSQDDYSWERIDKACQYLDVPFIPKKFEELHESFGKDGFRMYCEFFQQAGYDELGWGDYFKEFKRLKEAGYIQDELPVLQDAHRRELQEKWGFNYDDEALFYLDSLYNGLLTTQNVNGSLQVDQAEKLCKISHELNMRIQSGATDIDKLIGSYEKLVKIADFTPKNVKNASDFDSIGELIKWCEKKGFVNTYYDNVTRDIVDETMKNIQAYNRRLYTNESGVAEQIQERIKSLEAAEKLDSYYDIEQSFDTDEYENAGYVELFEDDDDFNVEI